LDTSSLNYSGKSFAIRKQTVLQQNTPPKISAYGYSRSQIIFNMPSMRTPREHNLRVGVGHEQKMPLLTELGNLFWSVYYKYAGPTDLVLTQNLSDLW
jgi:hypothetical protein